MINTSRIMPVLKVETDIITSIAASLIGTYVILVIIYVEPYKTIDNIIMGLMSHRSIMISIRVSWLILQISKANARITDNNSYLINTSKSNRRYISTPPFLYTNNKQRYNRYAYSTKNKQRYNRDPYYTNNKQRYN